MGSTFIKQIQARAYMRGRFFRVLYNKGTFDGRTDGRTLQD